ncbi:MULTISPECIES: hypothetical protein [Streptomyces]|uniref:hypothetical protein n=1 Tax=Streptomyces TaxID=1883 RepID=UPI0003A8431A|nr:MULTISPECIES: hypothetical protein [Streptomyces]
MTGTGGEEMGVQAARSRALAVLRVRSRALAVALLPAAAAVILLAGGATGHLTGGVWDALRWVVSVLALLVLAAAAAVALVVARARPAVTPTVTVDEESAPDLYGMVRDLADRLDVPAPSAIALTPDCDSWLEDRTHPAHGRPPPAPEPDGATLPGGPAPRRGDAAPVLVIGSPFLWWMRVGELRAVLAPVVAGTGPSAHPDIAAARRFIRGLDAAAAVVSAGGRRGPLSRAVHGGLGRVVRLLLRGCRVHAAEMERGVAWAAAERAQAVDYGVRIVAQEQVGLAYAGWDRLLTRVALPAWRMGRWPARLDVGVVAALTELSRRDRLAEGFASRLGERPACDLLEEPGAMDEAVSLLAARLFHGGPSGASPDWSPVGWDDYPEEVVDRTWRTDAARLHRVLDALGVRRAAEHTAPGTGGPTLARVLDHLTTPADEASPGALPTPAPAAAPDPAEAPNPAAAPDPATAPGAASTRAHAAEPAEPAGRAEPPGSAEPAGGDGSVTRTGSPADAAPHRPPAPAHGDHDTHGGHLATHPHVAQPDAAHLEADLPGGDSDDPPGHRRATPTAPAAAPTPAAAPAVDEADDEADDDDLAGTTARGAALAAGLSAQLAREEAEASVTGAVAPDAPPAAAAPTAGPAPDPALWDDRALPLLPLQPPRTGREILTAHVTAMVCCAAMDTAGAVPGLDWLDGPSLLFDGVRAADLAPSVLTLVETGDPGPLRTWMTELGIRPEKPVRLV